MMQDWTGRSIVKPTLAAGAVAVTLSLLTTNPLLTGFSFVVLTGLVLLTWRPDEPPVLLFLCVMQWLQGSAKVFQADLLGKTLYDLPAAHHLEIGTAATIEQAAWLTLAWVAASAVGIRLARIGMDRGTEDDAGVARSLRLSRLVALYAISTAAILAVTPFASGRLRQAVVAAADLRWAVVFLLFWTVWRGRRSRFWLLAIFFVEVVAGFLSYFASFRVPVFLLAIAIASGPMLFRARQLVGFAAVAAVALYLGVLWSAVKVDYRDELNQGTGEQVVAIGRGEQLAALARLVGTIDGRTLEDGVEKLADRIGYIDYFAYCLEHVPAVMPHENGLLWRQAVSHVLQPRVLFPDKPSLESDTLVAERYTGLDLMSWTGTTSVALGLPAEAYVDFGLPWMMLAGVWIGLLYGLCFRVVAGRDPHRAVRRALAVALLLPFATIEPSTIKFVGGYLTRLIMAVVVLKTLLAPIGRWLLPPVPAAATAQVRPLRPRARTSGLAREDHVPTR